MHLGRPVTRRTDQSQTFRAVTGEEAWSLIQKNAPLWLKLQFDSTPVYIEYNRSVINL